MLTNAERSRLDTAVTRVETSTGAQVVVARLPKSDSYPELPWIAFAGVASLAALILVVGEWLAPSWQASTRTMAIGILSAGAAAALAAIFMPPFARVFLHHARAEIEVRQQARSLFLEHELFVTRERCGVLLLASIFERVVVVLPDKGLRARVPGAVWTGVVDTMRNALARGQRAEAIEIGLTALEAALLKHGFHGGGSRRNELSDGVIETRET